MRDRIERVIAARLKDYEIPSAIKTGMADDIMDIVNEPKHQVRGVAVMTAEASMDADKNGRNGKVKPTIL